ncbi:hypothetical protein ACEWY4_020246 [Coilia grayii]|uniref:pyruvate kinase n=1 Tax=Coilia grayii TaxID=363190 RepID=A0ABD1JC18_9TELE
MDALSSLEAPSLSHLQVPQSLARIRRYSDVMALPDTFIQKQQLDASMADTFLEHLCLLDIDQEPIVARNTSIICTIGPASRSVPKLKEMLRAGMDIARLNFSHGSHEYHGETIKNIREAVETLTSDPLCYRSVAIALDTKGQRFAQDSCEGIFIDDGLLALKVLEIGEDWVETRVENGGTLGSRKGVNLPGANLINLPAVSERDRADLQFGVEQGVDMVFASFIRSARDVRAVRDALGPKAKTSRSSARWRVGREYRTLRRS